MRGKVRARRKTEIRVVEGEQRTAVNLLVFALMGQPPFCKDLSQARWRLSSSLTTKEQFSGQDGPVGAGRWPSAGCAHNFFQRAGIEALSKEGEAAVARMRAVNYKRRKLLGADACDGVRDPGYAPGVSQAREAQDPGTSTHPRQLLPRRTLARSS